jgi:hypothetical protein
MTKEEFSQFDILAWWKEKESQYTIIADIARDLLIVQASMVASNFALSLSGRILSLRRTVLPPPLIKTCICLKDHLDAAERIQHVSTLEDETSLETMIHEVKVATGIDDPLSDEEIPTIWHSHNPE